MQWAAGWQPEWAVYCSRAHISALVKGSCHDALYFECVVLQQPIKMRYRGGLLQQGRARVAVRVEVPWCPVLPICHAAAAYADAAGARWAASVGARKQQSKQVLCELEAL